MGGFGSGRWQRGRNTTDDYRVFDVRRLHRDNLLVAGKDFNMQWARNGKTTATINVKTQPGQLTLNYRHKRPDGRWQPMEYAVSIVWTSCNYGGKRPWLICPMGGCGRRVAILYGADIFACRHCRQLAYTCQRETVDDRALRRAQNIRKKLGGSANMMEPFPPRPKGMYWDTYWRMEDQYYVSHRIELMGMAKKIGMKIDI